MAEAVLTHNEFQLFRDLIYELAGISLGPAKRDLVQARLQRRLRHHALSSFSDYYELVTGEFCPADEIEAMTNCLTTNTTSFYREPHHFEFVKGTVIPEILKAARPGDGRPNIRIWHAGCSSGEEPYSLANTLAECRKAFPNQFTARQLASDIDTDVLALAQRGVYDEEKVAGLAEGVRRSAFLRGCGEQSNLYKIKPDLSAQITFRQINLLDEHWPMRPDTLFDMIWCRNVVIYFDKATQRKLFARFSERLRPGGYLFIGHSESLLGVSNAYESLGHTIYRRKAAELAMAA